jgi:hypothetical protein
LKKNNNGIARFSCISTDTKSKKSIVSNDDDDEDRSLAIQFNSTTDEITLHPGENDIVLSAEVTFNLIICMNLLIYFRLMKLDIMY